MYLMIDLDNIFFNHQGKVCDKWENYVQIYEKELAKFIFDKKPVSLLEIGVQNGGSLEIWAKILPQGSKVTGIDINEKCRPLNFDNDNISIIIVDASNHNELKKSINGMAFDIIIDDGSHISSDVINTFCTLFQSLLPGGLYFIEDLHCSYLNTHKGGFTNQSSSMNWLKSITDALNYDFFEDDNQINTTVKQALKLLNEHLASITFYSSICVINKLTLKKIKPYSRIITGQDMSISPVHECLQYISPNQLEAFDLSQITKYKIDKDLLEILHFKTKHEIKLLNKLKQCQQDLLNLQSKIKNK